MIIRVDSNRFGTKEYFVLCDLRDQEPHQTTPDLTSLVERLQASHKHYCHIMRKVEFSTYKLVCPD